MYGKSNKKNQDRETASARESIDNLNAAVDAKVNCSGDGDSGAALIGLATGRHKMLSAALSRG